MKIFRITFLCAVAFLAATACGEKSTDTTKHVSISCKTEGFTDGLTQTHATWEENDQFYLYRGEDWTSALLTLTSGAGSDTAIFKGKSKSSKVGYYAVYPSSSAGAIRPNGDILLTVKPNNIFFSNENTISIAPQIGTVDNNNLTFTSIFGALRFRVEPLSSISLARVSVPTQSNGLNGKFIYNLTQNTLNGETVNYSILLRSDSPIDISEDHYIYIAMPVGDYSRVELIVGNDQTDQKLLYKAENVSILRNTITDVASIIPEDLPAIVDSWHMKSFNGTDVDMALYIEFKYDGRFTIYQRDNSLEYVIFEGTYTIDANTSTISGTYDDGTSWAESYTFNISSDGCLVMTGNTSSEESVYESANMPTLATKSNAILTSRGAKKPL